MNKVVLIGRITKDIDLRYTSSNIAVASFTIAINREYLSKDGKREADFINCVTYKKQAENLKKYCSKGSHIALDGKISTRTYDDKEGKKVYVTEVIADNIQFLDAKNSGQADKELKDEIDKAIESKTSGDEPYISFGEEIELEDSDLCF
jgi:single-strand DNA-binding protein